MKTLFSILLSFSFLFSFCQLKPVGSWTDHLPYQSGTSITTDGELVYCATKTGLFTYNSIDNSIERYSKVNLLNDINPAKIEYSFQTKSLLIVYENSNIDILKDGRVINLPFLKNNPQSQKFINEIKLQGKLAYLSFGFGILVIDLEREEIVDTYKFGTNGNAINVNSTEVYNGKVYAATNAGLYQADLTANLLDFNSWSRLGFKSNHVIHKVFKNNFLNIITNEVAESDSTFFYDGQTFIPLPDISGKEFIALSKTLAGESIFFGSSETVFIDSSSNKTTSYTSNNQNIIAGVTTKNGRYFLLNPFDPLVELDNTSYNVVLSTKPNGPFAKSVFDIEVSENFVWAVNGRFDGAYNNGFNGARIYRYDKSNWTSFLDFAIPSLGGIFDVVSVNIDPENEARIFFGSWSGGLLKFNKDAPFFKQFDTGNSSLNDRKVLPGWIGVGETEFDQDGNLWVTNPYNINCLSVQKKNTEWKNFNFADRLQSAETAIYDIMIDENGYKWLALERDNAIIVFDDNGTIDDISDDRSILLTGETGKGSIPGDRGLIVESDKNGAIWLGSSDGIAVHFNPASVFETNSRDFQRIIVFDGENNEIVLENANITALAIDGANQKWVGTDNSGVLLLSEDGKETLLEFNVDNSPLYSNSISAIAIDDFTGEVYIATSEGLLSYRARATKGQDNFSSVNIFPNPIREDYKGPITIQGLVNNSTVKITDVNGTLINELKAQGGTATWNGNNFSGRRASTGIYLLFMSGEDEDSDLKTEVGKILFVN